MIFIKNDSNDPYFNHALEEFILEKSNEEAFILWRNRPSILIGRNQNTLSEIDIDYVKKNNIDVVRRLSGGGTVFCDLGNINFTFITNKSTGYEGFEKFAKPVIDALNSLDVPAVFTGRNDITISGKKFSGNAQYHYKNRLLHHGTLLYSGDLSMLSGALISKPLKFADKSVKSNGARVTNISSHLPTPMDVLEFKDYLKDFIMNTYHIETQYILTQEDLQSIQTIMDTRFKAWEWNYGNSPKYTFNNSVKYPSGLIEYHLNVEKGIIVNIAINGDFFGKESIKALEEFLIGTRHDYTAIISTLKILETTTNNFNDYISGLSLDDFATGLCDLKPTKSHKKKPEWLRVKIQGGKETGTVRKVISDLNLNTVCLEANCPNRMECYNRKTATFMILGRNCTRNCTFCNVTKNAPDPVNIDEPQNIAKAINALGLRHAVITSVTRDDLEDQGAQHFANVVNAIKSMCNNVTIELLIPDMQGNEALLDIILASNPDIFNHNIETVPSLYSTVRPMASFQRSLHVLNYAKRRYPNIKTKSGIMLGLGETQEEIIETLHRLREVDCDILTLGQYLQPSPSHIDVVEYIEPSQFDFYKKTALELGFKAVASAPLVRSSYHADSLNF